MHFYILWNIKLLFKKKQSIFIIIDTFINPVSTVLLLFFIHTTNIIIKEYIFLARLLRIP